VATGETVGQHFISLDFIGQRKMLLDAVKFYACNVKSGAPGKLTRHPSLRIVSRLSLAPVTVSAVREGGSW
jgi:hypothetical protein